jgi:protein-S-isoprenylcysteine O-methyltransferase Ste14
VTPTHPTPTQRLDSHGRTRHSHVAARPERVVIAVKVITAVITIVVCAPLVPALMVAVAGYRWPSWWLLVAGMLTAWTADAVRALARHAFTTFLTARQARQHDPSAHFTHHAAVDERGTRAGEPR